MGTTELCGPTRSRPLPNAGWAANHQKHEPPNQQGTRKCRPCWPLRKSCFIPIHGVSVSASRVRPARAVLGGFGLPKWLGRSRRCCLGRLSCRSRGGCPEGGREAGPVTQGRRSPPQREHLLRTPPSRGSRSVLRELSRRSAACPVSSGTARIAAQPK